MDCVAVLTGDALVDSLLLLFSASKENKIILIKRIVTHIHTDHCLHVPLAKQMEGGLVGGQSIVILTYPYNKKNNFGTIVIRFSALLNMEFSYQVSFY